MTVKSNLKLAHVSSAGRHAVNHLCADFSKNGPTLLTVSLSDHLNSSLNPSIFDNQTLLSVFSGSKLGRAKEAGVWKGSWATGGAGDRSLARRWRSSKTVAIVPKDLLSSPMVVFPLFFLKTGTTRGIPLLMLDSAYFVQFDSDKQVIPRASLSSPRGQLCVCPHVRIGGVHENRLLWLCASNCAS
jgi:hypothetical protein